MSVYFVQAGDGGPIKIGFARNVPMRLVKMRVDCPIPLTVLAIAEGGADYERELQLRFRKHLRRGEWFDPAPELLALIATMPRPIAERPGRRVRGGSHPLRRYRCDKEITIGQFADRAQTTKSTLSRIEAGLIRPTHDLMLRLARATENEVSIEALVHAAAEARAA